MTGPEEANIQSPQQHSVPSVSSCLGQNNGMGANHQAATNVERQISQPVPKRLPTLHSWLARNLQMISLVGPLLKVTRHHSKFIVQGPKVWVSKHRNSWQRKHYKSDTKVTLMVVASCPGRKNPLTLLCFLTFIQVLTRKWRCDERKRKRRRMDRWQKTK